MGKLPQPEKVNSMLFQSSGICGIFLRSPNKDERDFSTVVAGNASPGNEDEQIASITRHGVNPTRVADI
jgi:hypothetical protein